MCLQKVRRGQNAGNSTRADMDEEFLSSWLNNRERKKSKQSTWEGWHEPEKMEAMRCFFVVILW
jgi:hypothetical protein